MISKLSFVVKCKEFNKPKFRVWLNENMLLEQTYICSNEYEVLLETCEVNIESGSYTLKLEPLTNSIFEISSIKVNDVPSEIKFSI